MPVKSEPSSLNPLQISFTPATVKCLKIIAQPIKALPKWHPGKGKPGWVLVSEVVVD